ncbi:hypothetical protein EMPS_08965 [Entomortierella parvispora]|uniref:Uncharacterized protein n=1 Tax=Entomortierella parvispora TaxID=205924 RepID=A0A9P3HHC9_9FUNG|nr:hypothetical protein EMPS_08965 [Entomortierella parvispora]
MRHQPNAPRKVIAVDLDEVLAKTSLAIADWHNVTYGTTLTLTDFISYDYTKIWGGTREESINKWRTFFDSPYFLKVEPVEGSLETLKLLKSRRFSLVIVTARQQFVADLTKKFVDRHYPGIFESIYFANHFLTEQEKMTFISKPKSVICRDVHAQLLIDDSLENAIEVSKAGIPVLLFDLNGSYKWNKLADGQELPEKVTRVKSWKDVQAWFPRPRSPLSSQCISRDDQFSEDEEEEEEDEDEEISEDELEYGNRLQRQRLHHDPMISDSDSDEDLDVDEDEMNEISKREQEEDDHHQGRTLRRRKLMMMDYSSSSDEEEEGQTYNHYHHPHGDDMDSDDQDVDLESGQGGHHYSHGGRRHISQEELEKYQHQHETMYTDEDSMELEVNMEMDMTETASATLVSISTAATITESMTIPTSPETMAVESLTIKSPPMSLSESGSLMETLYTAESAEKTAAMDMEEVPLS